MYKPGFYSNSSTKDNKYSVWSTYYLWLHKLYCRLFCVGREFKALFISTVECVHDGFKSANPTKSFCNRYVFNTALTRAQSLVVVAGNPFLLLKVEAAMPEPMGCWRAYLKRCIDHNTFIVPKHFDNESTVLTELKQLVEQPEKGNTK